MASPFQLQARRRKLIYIGLIVVLFTAAFFWRNSVVATQAQSLALREVDRGDVELTGSAIRLGLTGSRGLATCALWISAIDKQKKNQWNELEILVRQVTKLQPHFITPWLFQSWNLTYNVSVGSDRINDKYFYITRGIELLTEGERQNRNNPDLRYWIGFYHQHKICKSDETNVQRSLFQLSLIPPNERDPARFKQINPATNQEEINYIEFEDFCKKHPQLVRRLHDGMMRDTLGEARRQFTCAKAEDVVRFLADNYRVPSPYEDVAPAAVGSWQKRDDKLRASLIDRFPPVPPKRNPPPPQRLFDPNELTADKVTELDDSIDAYAIARAWYAYAQEPIPDPDDMPGSTKPVTDRVLQRKPKQIMTLIFRNHPALAQSDVAERLEQEGWFDNEPWLIRGWFPRDRFVTGKDERNQLPEAKVGNDRPWSQAAWQDAYERYTRHGQENHLLFAGDADQANKEQLAREFAVKFHVAGGKPPELRTESLDEHTRDCYLAAQFLFENDFYRKTSNFDAHHNRTFVEAKPETVEGRKQFYTAERLRWEASVKSSLEKYAAALPYWRDKVLLKNKAYRKSFLIQEESYDWQYRYLRLFHEQNGKALKQQLASAARMLPLMPTFDSEAFPGWILDEPLNVFDEDGDPLIDDDSRRRVLYRKPAPAPAQHAATKAAPVKTPQVPKAP